MQQPALARRRDTFILDIDQLTGQLCASTIGSANDSLAAQITIDGEGWPRVFSNWLAAGPPSLILVSEP
jgi:hypothetical protein